MKRKKFSITKYLKVTLVYFVLFIAIFSMIDYYAWMSFNFIWFIVISAVAALMIGYIHVKRGKHDHVDEVAEELL